MAPKKGKSGGGKNKAAQPSKTKPAFIPAASKEHQQPEPSVKATPQEEHETKPSEELEAKPSEGGDNDATSEFVEDKPLEVTENTPPEAPKAPLSTVIKKPTSPPASPTLESLAQKWDQKSKELADAVKLRINASTDEQRDAGQRQLSVLSGELINLREELAEAEKWNDVKDIIPIRLSMIESLNQFKKVLRDVFAKDREEDGVSEGGKDGIGAKGLAAEKEKGAEEEQKLATDEEYTAANETEVGTTNVQNISAERNGTIIEQETAFMETEKPTALEKQNTKTKDDATIEKEATPAATKMTEIKQLETEGDKKADGTYGDNTLIENEMMEKEVVDPKKEDQKAITDKGPANPPKRENASIKDAISLENAGIKEWGMAFGKDAWQNGIIGGFRIADYMVIPKTTHFYYACHFALLPAFLALSDGKPFLFRMFIWMLWALPNFFWDFSKSIRIFTGAMVYILLCYYYISH
ncbi:hypothetical protein TWF718_005000 [Orbilia javanica]|uniref:Uncharacterized protein n=1 Tax=Orbilia javanica TaxID=47235 RepID=A0AAN8NCS3_9PEZI